MSRRENRFKDHPRSCSRELKNHKNYVKQRNPRFKGFVSKRENMYNLFTNVVCYYHRKYYTSAKRCIPPCNMYNDKSIVRYKPVTVETLVTNIPCSITKKTCLIHSGYSRSLVPCKEKPTGKSTGKVVSPYGGIIKTYKKQKITMDLGLGKTYEYEFYRAEVDQIIIGADFIAEHDLVTAIYAIKDKETYA